MKITAAHAVHFKFRSIESDHTIIAHRAHATLRTFPPWVQCSMPPALLNENPAVVSCSTCRANCCKLEVILMGEDDVPHEFVQVDRWGGHVMARLADGWCIAVDRNTMRCTIYDRRPGVCRDFALGGSDCLRERAALSTE